MHQNPSPLDRALMREDVLLRPAVKIKADAMRQEVEAGSCKPLASLAGEYHIQPVT